MYYTQKSWGQTPRSEESLSSKQPEPLLYPLLTRDKGGSLPASVHSCDSHPSLKIQVSGALNRLALACRFFALGVCRDRLHGGRDVESIEVAGGLKRFQGV
jgi:hypothetical protein